MMLLLEPPDRRPPSRLPPTLRCRRATFSSPLFYFLCDLRKRYPHPLTVDLVAKATGYGTAALRNYLRGRVAAPCRYVPIAVRMLEMLRGAGAVSEAEYLAQLRRLKDLAFDAVLESYPLPELQGNEKPELQKTKNVHLLVRDEHFHGAKVAIIYESSKYSGKKVSKKVCINSVYLRFA